MIELPAACDLLRVGCGLQEVVRVGDGANENPAWAEEPGHIVEHLTRLGLGLERVVHAELHAYHVGRTRAGANDVPDRALVWAEKGGGKPS